MSTFWSRFWEKTKKEPLVPLGCGATLAALSAGLYAFKSGQKHLSQKMMRARVVAQGATIAVLFMGSYFNFTKSKEKEQRQLQREDFCNKAEARDH